MHLTDEASVRARLNLQDDEGVVAVIQSALDGTTIHAEALLNTYTDSDEHVDVFHLSAPHLVQAGTYQLRLSNGFVDADDITVSVGESLFDTAPVQLAADEFKLSAEKGFVLVSDEHEDKYIKVEYTAGFESLSDVPDWLGEWAISQAVKLMSMQQTADEKPALAKVYQMIDAHKVVILDRKLRISSRALTPVFSE